MRESINWSEIRQAFEAGETNISRLSKRFSVKRDSIAKHRDVEQWATSGQLAGTARSNVISLVTRKAIESNRWRDRNPGRRRDDCSESSPAPRDLR
jgi:hypothetical protein